MADNINNSITNALQSVLGDSSTLKSYVANQPVSTEQVQTKAPESSIVNNIEPSVPTDNTPIDNNPVPTDNNLGEVKQVPNNSTTSTKPELTVTPNFPISVPPEQPTSSTPIVVNNDDILKKISSIQDSLNRSPLEEPKAPDLTKKENDVVQPVNTSKDNSSLFTPTTPKVTPVENKDLTTATSLKENVNTEPVPTEKVTPTVQPSLEKTTPTENIVPTVQPTLEETTPVAKAEQPINTDNVEPAKNYYTTYNIPLNPQPDKSLDTTKINEQVDDSNIKLEDVFNRVNKQDVAPLTDNVEPTIFNSSKPLTEQPPQLPNTTSTVDKDNITPSSITPSSLNTETEPNNLSPLSDITLDHTPTFKEIASNTGHTNKLIENLTKAVYTMAKSTAGNSVSMPPMPVQMPSSGGSQMNAVPDAVNATYSGMIPTVRSKFL